MPSWDSKPGPTSQQSASPITITFEWKGKRGGRPLTTSRVFDLSQNCGGTEPKSTVTCMMLKALANDRGTFSPLQR
ncbi:hypothetical protein TNCV_1432101 [Trichonephila clavipes]|nr:hypothetical protein TNCV_1432101 [Trichonephila clavipes]